MATIDGNAGANLLAGTALADLIRGFGGDDTLEGGDGDDTLNGGAGTDSMTGGAGNDSYVVDAAGDAVVETDSNLLTGGIDTVFSYLAAYTLGANVENLRLSAAGAANGTGNGLNNVIFAGAGDNVINGGAGRDTVSYQYAAAAVNLSLAVAGPQATGGSGSDTLISIEAIVGSNFNDTIAGSAGNNVLNGGTGVDTVSYAGAGAAVVVDLGTTAQQDTGGAGLDTLKGFENLVGSNFNDTLSGSAGNNILAGGAGNDTLLLTSAVSGFAVDLTVAGPQATGHGLDTFSGFEGVVGSDFADTITGAATPMSIQSGGGDDIIVLNASSFTVEGGEGNDHITANTGLGNIKGGAGNDTLVGGPGDWNLEGEDGDDTYIVSSALTSLNGTDDGTDTVIAQVAAFTLGSYQEVLVIAHDGPTQMEASANTNRVVAGSGDDVITGGAFLNTIDYSAATAAVVVNLATGVVTGGSGNDQLSSFERVIGSDFRDSLTGSSFHTEQFDGGAGADTMTGGAGNDTYFVDDSGDLVVELAGEGSLDTVRLGASAWTMGAHIETLWIDATGGASVTGNAQGNLIYASAADDTIDGGGGQDFLSYLLADAGVTVSLAVAGPQDTGGAGVDSLLGIEDLAGSAFDDELTGNAGANALYGGGGADTLSGGDGDDTYYLSNGAEVVIEFADDGNDTAHIGAGSYQLADNVENAVFDAGPAAANLTGNAGDNHITASSGDNVIDGAGGYDTVSYAGAASGVTVSLAIAGAQATGGSGIDTLASIEALVGSFHADTLTGDAGENRLDGGNGNDTLAGGIGADTYFIANSGDQIIELDGQGYDRAVIAGGVTWPLSGHVEAVRIDTNTSVNVTGNGLANLFELWQDGGTSTLNGGGGTDTLSFALSDSGILLDLANPNHQTTGFGTISVAGFENLLGSSLNDMLTGGGEANSFDGGSGNDSLNGGGGNDTLDGGAGNDTLAGGAGNDVYYLLSGTDTVVEAANEGTDLVYTSSSVSLAANVENAVISGNAAVNVTGNASANHITANGANNAINGGGGNDTVSYATAASAVTVNLSVAVAQATGGSGTDTLTAVESVIGSAHNDTLSGTVGNNTLDGGSGSDQMAGGAGNDTYHVNQIGDVVTEAAASGTDTIVSTISWTLGANVEYLRLDTGAAVNGTGNSGDNVIYAGGGNNVLAGAGGTDTASYFYAGAGVTVSLATGLAQATGGSGTDTLSGFENLSGSGYADSLSGGAAGNVLYGTGGNDTLNGAGGNDTLYGGTGNDTFRFDTLPNAGTNLDTLADFDAPSDTISLENAIFSSLGVGSLSSSMFRVGVAAADSNDYIVYDENTGALYYDADGNGAGAQVQFATITGSPVLTAADFVVT